MPASPIGGMSTVKIFVLYLMRNINYPLSFVTINDIVMQNDYVMYLDFAMAFPEMLDGGLIEEAGQDERGEMLYSQIVQVFKFFENKVYPLYRIRLPFGG